MVNGLYPLVEYNAVVVATPWRRQFMWAAAGVKGTHFTFLLKYFCI